MLKKQSHFKLFINIKNILFYDYTISVIGFSIFGFILVLSCSVYDKDSRNGSHEKFHGIV